MNISTTTFAFILTVCVSTVSASTIWAPDRIAIAKEATYVLVGKVTATSENQPSNSPSCNVYHYTATIAVVENIRGTANNTIVLPVCIGNRGFNRELKKDHLYIFFLRKEKDRFARMYPMGSVIEFL